MAEAPSESRVWAALCLAGDAKPVKDALKGRGWLDHSWKVRVRPVRMYRIHSAHGSRSVAYDCRFQVCVV